LDQSTPLPPPLVLPIQNGTALKQLLSRMNSPGTASNVRENVTQPSWLHLDKKIRKPHDENIIAGNSAKTACILSKMIVSFSLALKSNIRLVT
jgi:hypothetical protein